MTEIIFCLHAKTPCFEAHRVKEQQEKNGSLCYKKLNFVVLVGKAFWMIKAGPINSSGLVLDPKFTYFWKTS